MPVVQRIFDCDRVAGYGSEPKPPRSLLGKRVTIRRPLIRWNGYRVTYKGKEYVLMGCEIGKCCHYDRARKLVKGSIEIGFNEGTGILQRCGDTCPLMVKLKCYGRR